MSLSDQFDRFLEDTVNLNPGRLNELNKRVETIEGVLRAATEQPDLVIVEARPQGSFAQKTIIRPYDEKRGFDADLLVECEDYYDSARGLLDAIKSAMKESAVHADMVSPKNRCVMLQYANQFHIDLVPCVRRDGTLKIANRQTDDWEPTDPDGFNGWLDDRDEHANGFLVPTIRLCKYMRDFKGRPKIKSVIFTRLLADRVMGRLSSDYADLPTTLTLLLEDLADWAATQYIPPTLTEPTCSAELRLHDTNWNAFQTQMKSVAGRARKALDETDEDKALALWRELFGSKFPAPEKRTAARALDPFEEDLYLKYGIPTDLQGTVTIDARVARKDGYRSGALTTFGSVQPGRDLYFKLGTTSIQYPYDVYWKVKNTGAQARAYNGGRGLRGEISQDNNGPKASRHESTRYVGDHYVEIYIVKGGVCVARARQPVIIRC